MTYLKQKWQTQHPWTFTKQGVVIPKYPVFDGENDGNYFQTTLDMSGVANFPGDRASYCSSDHDSTGTDGIYMSYRKNGTWYTYDQGVANGDFDYLTSKPSGNPVYRDTTVGDQTETPCINWVTDQFVMTYHQSGAGFGQSTVRARSTDGVNWTRDDVVLDFATGGDWVGDGHTGYLRWALNKFPGVPYKYIGYHLAGGQVSGLNGVSGCDDPRTEDWTIIAQLHKLRGPYLDQLGLSQGNIMKWLSACPESVHQVGRYWYMLCGIGTATAGAGNSNTTLYWVPFEDDGYTIAGLPELAVPRGSSIDDEEVAAPQFVGSSEMYYDAVSGATDNQTALITVNRNGGTPRRMTQLTLKPPAGLTTETQDFSALSAVPTGYSEISDGTPTFTYTDDLIISAGNGDGGFIFKDTGFIPDNYEFLELYVQDIFMRTTNPAIRQYWLGFCDTAGIRSTWSNALYHYCNQTGGNLIEQLVGGSSVRNENTGSWGSGHWNSYAADAPKNYGFRWYPQSNKLWIIGQSEQEYKEISLHNTFDTSLTYFPFLGMECFSAQTWDGQEGFGSLRLRYKAV